MFRQFPAVLFVLLALFATTPRADYPIEVVELRHNLLQDVLPVVQPLMGEGETLTGMNNQLIIKAPPARVRQIRELLSQIDRPPRRLIVTVSNQGELDRYSRGHSTAADINSGDGNITINPRGQRRETASAGVESGDSRARIGVHDSSSQGGRTVGQHVQVMEGRRAWINAGVQVPVRSREGYFAGGVPYERRSITYHDVRSGFYVIPRLSGEFVTLEILQHDDRPGDRPRTFRTQSANSTVSGRLGEWINLGGISKAESDSRRDIGQSASSGMTGGQQIWVKVDCPDC